MTQIRLEITTGDNVTSPVYISGTFNASWEPLLLIAYGQPITALNNQSARDALRDLDNIVTVLRDSPQFFGNLTSMQQGHRLQVLEFFERVRAACREHSYCTVYVLSVYPPLNA